MKIFLYSETFDADGNFIRAIFYGCDAEKREDFILSFT